jgi:hypothetical protein
MFRFYFIFITFHSLNIKNNKKNIIKKIEEREIFLSIIF